MKEKTKINIKKIISIILLVLLFFACIYGVWYFLFKDKIVDIPFLTTEPENADFFFEPNLSGNDLFDPEYRKDSNSRNLPDLDETPPILRQLSSEPVSGYTFFQKEFTVVDIDSSTTASKTVKKNKSLFRFMEKATGHVYETIEDSLTLNKINKETINKTSNVTFLDKGNKIIFEQLSQNIESINSFWGEFIKTGTSTENITFKYEPYSIINTGFTPSPTSNSFAYQVKSNEGSAIYIGYSNKQKPTEVYVSPIKEWLIDWQNNDLISLNTKPSAGVPGYLFILNTKTKALTKVINGVSGLTSKLSPSGKFVIFSENSDNTTSLFVKNISTGEIKKLPLSTISDKCVFNPTDEKIIYCGGPSWLASAQYPDDWYKGKVSFKDFVWEINQENQATRLFYEFKETEGVFDLTDVKITTDGKFLVFVNKKDLTLWSLDINRASNIGLE